MTLRNADYYSERALNERKLVRTAQNVRARKVREALEHQYDTLLSPKKIRSILKSDSLSARKGTE